MIPIFEQHCTDCQYGQGRECACREAVRAELEAKLKPHKKRRFWRRLCVLLALFWAGVGALASLWR